MIAQRTTQRAADRTLQVLPVAMGQVIVGYRIGTADADLHGFVFCDASQVLTMLGRSEDIIATHFPCHLCRMLGYGPEQLRRDLQTVLQVQ